MSEYINEQIITETHWYPEEQLLITHLSGRVGSLDVERWKQSLDTSLSAIPDNGAFKIMVNLYGFKASDFEVHKKYRVIIPSLLADYGHRTGYLALFPEVEVPLTYTRGIICQAAVHVHQDATKINDYDTRFRSANERFFTDPVQAERWIRAWKPA